MGATTRRAPFAGAVVLLAVALSACSTAEPERGEPLAHYNAQNREGEPVGSAVLFMGQDDPNVVIEEVQIRDEKGRVAITCDSTLWPDEPMRFRSRFMSTKNLDRLEVQVDDGMVNWRRQRGLAVSRSAEAHNTKAGRPILLAWQLTMDQGLSSSMVLWHDLIRHLSAEELQKRGERSLKAFNVQVGRHLNLYSSYRESRKISIEGQKRVANRLFVSTRASGHTVWVDADQGELLAIDNVFGTRMVRTGFSWPERQVEGLPESMAEEALSIRTQEVELAGTLTYPKAHTEGNGPLPVVILIHGSGSMDRDQSPFMVFRHLAHDLGQSGYAVLRYDKRGVGQSRFLTQSEDQVGQRNVTLQALADDVKAWVNLLAKRPDIDPKRIVLAGHSEGGYIAPMVAARHPGVWRVVMLAGPVIPLLEVLPEQARLVGEAHGMTESEIQQVLQQQSATLRQVQSDTDIGEGAQAEAISWLRSHNAHQPEAVLRSLDVPVLAIYASGDIQVPVSQAEKMNDVASQKQPGLFKIQILDGLDHLLMDNRGGRHGLGLMDDPDRRLDPRVSQHMVQWLAGKR